MSGPVIACYKALVKPEEKLRQWQISRITDENTFALLLAINDHKYEVCEYTLRSSSKLAGRAITPQIITNQRA